MTRLAPAPAQHGFTLVELLLTVTILSLIIGVLTDTLILGLRTTGDTQTRIAQVGRATVHRPLRRRSDVPASVAATPGGTACGIIERRARDDRAVGADARRAGSGRRVLARRPSGLSRSTCAVGATDGRDHRASISDKVTAFTATCGSPGACGTVHVDVQTAAGTNVPSTAFTLDVSRRQQ